MSRDRPFQKPPGMGLDDRAEQRRAILDKRQALLAKMAKASAARAQSASSAPTKPAVLARKPRDIERYMAALTAQPFHQLGLSEAAAVTPAYQRLVRSAAEVSSDGSVQVVMPWPPVRISPSAIAGLLTIAAVGSADAERVV